MSFSPDHVYSLDIETSTALVTGPDGKPGYNPGLDPLLGFITEAVVVGAEAGEVFTGEGTADDEARLLLNLDNHIFGLAPGLLTTWNGGPFDLPFLQTRSEENAVSLGLRVAHQDGLKPKYDALPGHGPEAWGLDGNKGHSGVYSGTWAALRGIHAHLDVSYAYKAFADKHGIKWGLKPVCEAFGISMITVDRTEMHLLTPAERREYVMSDGNGTRLLALNMLGLIDLGTGPLPLPGKQDKS